MLDCGLYRTAKGQFEVAADVDVAKIGAKAHYNVAVKPAIKALENARSKAAWAGRNLVISKAANTKTKQIAAELQGRITQLKNVTYNDFDAEKARLVHIFQVSYNNFNASMTSSLANADALTNAVRANPTPARRNVVISKGSKAKAKEIATALDEPRRVLKAIHLRDFDAEKERMQAAGVK